MDTRLESIFNNSNNLYSEFVQQQQFCDEVTNICKKNKNIFNAEFEDLHLVATDLVHFIYSAPLYQNSFYIHDKSAENSGRHFVVIPSQKESENYAMNQQCKMVFFGYDDLMYICDKMNVDYVVMFFEEKTLVFSKQEIENFLMIYQTQNPKSKYIIGQPSESYNELIKILSDKFSNFKSIKNLWLYHVTEIKKNNSSATYDVVVIDMPVSDYLLIKSYIENVAYKTNDHSIKVVLKDSDLGEFLLKTKVNPVFMNKD